MTSYNVFYALEFVNNNNNCLNFFSPFPFTGCRCRSGPTRLPSCPPGASPTSPDGLFPFRAPLPFPPQGFPIAQSSLGVTFPSSLPNIFSTPSPSHFSRNFPNSFHVDIVKKPVPFLPRKSYSGPQAAACAGAAPSRISASPVGSSRGGFPLQRPLSAKSPSAAGGLAGSSLDSTEQREKYNFTTADLECVLYGYLRGSSGEERYPGCAMSGLPLKLMGKSSHKLCTQSYHYVIM